MQGGGPLGCLSPEVRFERWQVPTCHATGEQGDARLQELATC